MGYDEVMRQFLERRTDESNASHLLPHLEPGMRLLDFGCGPGTISVGLARAVEPGEFHGIDMEESQIEIARAAAASGAHDNATFHVGDASAMPFEDEFFDLVIQFTMFTSILDNSMKRNIAQEMLRVLKPMGMILWYDYHISKPTNLDVKGIGKREIKGLFPNCSFCFKRVTLAPPLTGAIAPYSLLLCHLLDSISLLRTHYLVAISKNSYK